MREISSSHVGSDGAKPEGISRRVPLRLSDLSSSPCQTEFAARSSGLKPAHFRPLQADSRAYWAF